mgnify:CR=1 FL=1|jgi:hypothetical protein
MNTIKTIIFFAITLITLFINGCASVSPSILNPYPNPLPLKLKSVNFGLEGNQIIQFSSIKTATIQTDFATIFGRTLEQNICEEDRVKWGYADLRIVFDNWIYQNSYIPLTILGSVFYPWWILGGNVLWYERIIQVEIGIYDSKKNLIKKYIIDDYTDAVGIGLYNRNGHYNKKRLSGVEVIHRILQKFQNQIKNDIKFLNSELTKAGSIG